MSRINIAGFGTGRIEQLSSVAVRYSEALNVRFIDFYRYAIFSQFDRRANSIYLRIPRRLRIEGMTGTALEWVSALTMLMKTSDSQFCTTLPLQGVVSGFGLLTDERRWCPLCLEEMVAGAGLVYEPLVWRVNEASCCTVHFRALVSVCNQCKRGEQRFFVPNARVGCCRHCGVWLGCSDIEMQRAADETQVSAALLCSELLLLPQLLSKNEAMLPAKFAVRALRSHFFAGSNKRMGDEIGEKATHIGCYVRGEITPPLSVFIRLALATRTTMRQIFVTHEFLCSGGDVTSAHSCTSCGLQNTPNGGCFQSGKSSCRGNDDSAGEALSSTTIESANRGPSRWRRRTGPDESDRIRAKADALQAIQKKVAFVQSVERVVTDLKESGAPRPSVECVRILISSRASALNPWERTVITSSVSQAYAVGEDAISDGPRS